MSSKKGSVAATVLISGVMGLAAPGPNERPDNVAISAGQVTALYAVQGDATSSDSASLYTTGGNTNPSCLNNIFPLGLTTRTIRTANLQLIFWGTSWQTVSTPGATDDATAAANVTTAVGIMINGPFLSQLSQYGFQSLNLLQPVKVNSDPPAQFVYADVANLVQRLICNGQVLQIWREPSIPAILCEDQMTITLEG